MPSITHREPDLDPDDLYDRERQEEMEEGDMRKEVEMTISDLQREAHQYAVGAGFWDGMSTQVKYGYGVNLQLAKLALVVTEVAEAMEACRSYGPDNNLAEELADIMIRVGDFAGAYGIDLEKAIHEKMEYNRTRPYKHGKLA